MTFAFMLQSSPRSPAKSPSPSWGGVRGGGHLVPSPQIKNVLTRPPTPTLPHEGGGSAKAVGCVAETDYLATLVRRVSCREVAA